MQALTLDEISQANAREMDQVVYMLANNAGKARANREGGSRRQRNWRTLFLSTGEISLEAKLLEAGQRVRAGQDVRMIGLAADAGGGRGVWQTLHGFSSGAALSDHLSAASHTYCGTAGRAYLEQLARERGADPDALVSTLRALCQRFLDEHVRPGADGQVRSVAKRLAVTAAAGELATAYGITGWPEGEALNRVGACIKAWLDARGGAGAGEDMRALKQVRAFIAAHGASRFERIDDDDDDDRPKEQRVINRAGWTQLIAGKREYLITADCWRDEVCRGLNAARAAKAVDEAGFLLRGGD
ncbi:DUF927 domain-containing protein [Bradyrhizobium sp. Ec3.3]|uniref:DUF927 domain-containing protein n=1 Tax=Bradyrhizobium sp. Ec3.3 TaxID=189753 RepID=UPI000405BAE9|nr:DUF927 domain-containing protein [Bradyrhizobium sp. Ec3.3]